jgi:hypothetical protein
MDTKLETWRDLLERRLGAFATGQAVGDDADVVAATGVAVGEVQDDGRFLLAVRAPRAGYEAADR